MGLFSLYGASSMHHKYTFWPFPVVCMSLFVIFDLQHEGFGDSSPIISVKLAEIKKNLIFAFGSLAYALFGLENFA